MNKYFSNIQNYIFNFRKNNPFGIIILSIILVFLILLYFTIPAYYNYENFDKEIQKKVSKDFKLDLKNIKSIKYLILPSPHFLIEECDIYFLNDSKEKILTAKNLKLNVFSKNLHKKNKIELKNIYLNKIDLDLQYIDIKNFYEHLKYSISKPIYFSNSNIFFRDKKNEIISISKIKKFEYFFNLKSKEKKINIIGNLFGSRFNFKWKKNYSNPYLSISNIQFKSPKINISNKFDSNDEKFINALTNIKFLKNSFNLNYKFNQSNIEFIDDKSKLINTSKLVGNIDLNPFFFNLNLILSGIDLETILSNIFLNLNKINQSSHINFNGTLKIKLDEIDSRLFEKLIVNINFLEEKITFNELSLYLTKIGKINFSNPIIYEKNQKIFVKSKIKFDVDDQQELFRKFLIPRQNRVDLNKVYFTVEYDIDEKVYFLSNITFDKIKDTKIIFHEIKNIQQLNNLITNEFKKVSLD